MNREFAAVISVIGTGLLLLSGCISRSASGERSSNPAHRSVAASASAGSSPGERSPKPPALTEQSTLSDYLAHAALNNSGLRGAFEHWKAALERVPQVRALPDPRFTYRYFIQEVETRVGAQRQAFAMTQTFPWFGKLKLRGYAAMEAAEAERQRYNARKLKLFYRVKDAYYEYYYLKRAIAVVDENKRLLQSIERVLRTRFKAAAASHPSVVRVQVEIGRLDDRQRTLVDLREPIVARLNAALNRPASAPLPWPGDIRDQEVSVTDEELLIWMKHANPEVRALEYEAGRARHRVELAKKEYFPDVTVGVDYVDVATSSGGRNPSDDGKNAVAGTVSLNIPIWHEKISAGVREARLRHSAALHRKADKINTLGAELKLAAYRFRDADRRIDLYRDTLLPKAREALKATNAAFRAGKASYTDMIDSQRILLEFELAVDRALTDKSQRLAELEMLAGKELTEMGNAGPAPVVQKHDTGPGSTKKQQ